MGDVSHSGAKKKRPGGGQNKSYYYSLTYDEDDTGSLDYTPAADDELQRRVANILAETEIDDQHQVPALDDGRLDMNDNLFGEADDSRRNSRTLDFELSDYGGEGEGDEGEEEFQSVDSKSDTFRPEVETASVDDDFVRITRPYASGDARRQPPCQTEAAGAADDDVFVVSGAMMTSPSSSSERSPKAATSGPVRHTGSSPPLSVVYVKQQKPSTELYDGNFIDDDILAPQDERALDDNISQDLLPMPIEEMTLEMDEDDDDDDDDGIPDTASGVDADPIIFRKSAQRWYVRHRKLVIGAALVGSLLAAGGLAAVIYFAVAASS